MDKQELERLKKLAERATPGEWITGAHRHDPAWVVLPPTEDSWGFCIAQCQIRVNGFNNAAYIAAANPQTILAMIAEIERLEKEAGWLAWQLQVKDKFEVLSGRGGNLTLKTDWRASARKAVEAQCKTS